jgi:GTPase SAR1 family protein
MIPGLEQQDYRIKPSWGNISAPQDHQSISLPEGVRVLEIFEEAQQQLLILGEPGSGKTMLLLDLMKDLLNSAQDNNQQPIPVLIDLSSWNDPEQSLLDWLSEKIDLKYSLRADLAKEWLQTRKILPLLDGLDEVEPKYQHDCAVKINRWMTGDLEERPCGIVVCCRREQFEKVVKETLRLSRAIYLKALRPDQITDYFRRLKLSEVATEVQQDSDLRDFLDKPLFLSIVGQLLKENKFDLTIWKSRKNLTDKKSYLLDMYWEAMISRELVIDPKDQDRGIKSKTYGTKIPPNSILVQRGLMFIAKSLNQDFQADFVLERIQPRHLQKKEELLLYRCICYLFFAIVALLIPNVLDKFILTRTDFTENLVPFAVLGILFLSFPWLKYALEVNTIKIAEKFNFISLIARFETSFLSVLFSILSSVLLVTGGIIHLYPQVQYVIFFPIVTFSGVLINKITEWIFLNSREEIDDSHSFNQVFRKSILNIILFISFVLVIFLMIGWRLSFGLGAIIEKDIYFTVLLSYLVYIIFFASCEVLRPWVQHYILRIVMMSNKYYVPPYDLFLDYCTERLLLQRIGGRYRFMHKLLQDHFAAMELE